MALKMLEPKKVMQRGKQGALPFSLGLPSDNKADPVFCVPQAKGTGLKKLFAQAKSGAGSSKCVAGQLNVTESGFELKVEQGKPTAVMAKRLRLYLKKNGVPKKVTILDAEGNPVGEGADDSETGDEATVAGGGGSDELAGGGGGEPSGGGFFDDLADAATDAYDSASDAYDAVEETASDAYDAASDAYDSVSDTASDAYDAVEEAASDAYDAASDAASDAYDAASDTASDVYDSVADTASDAYDAVAEVASDAYEAASDGYDAVAEAASDAYDAVAEVASDAYDTVAEAVGDATEAVGEFAEEAFEDLSETIEDMLEEYMPDTDFDEPQTEDDYREQFDDPAEFIDELHDQLNVEAADEDGDPPEIIGSHQTGRAEEQLDEMEDEDQDAFNELLARAGSAEERRYLVKALGAGHDIDELTAFADRIRGQDRAWQQQYLHLTGDSSGREGITQQWSHSCGPTTTQAMRGEMDPIYALELHDDNPDITDVDENDGDAVNPNLAQEQEDMLETVSPSGSVGVAADRNDGASGQGRVLGDLLDAQSDVTGLDYDATSTGDEEGRAEAMEEISDTLRQGIPVPIRVQNPGAGHFLLIVDVQDGDDPVYTIHDPWTGNVYQKPASDFASNTLNLPGGSEFTHYYDPEEMDD